MDGRIWVILNLKQFNERYVDHIHFKKETLRSAVDAMRPECFSGSVDLKPVLATLRAKGFISTAYIDDS